MLGAIQSLVVGEEGERVKRGGGAGEAGGGVGEGVEEAGGEEGE